MSTLDEGNEVDTGGDNEAIEREARVQGWRPADEFKGKEKDWVDAETFVARGREIKQFTKRENEALRRELAEAKSRLEDQGKTIEEIRKYHEGMEKRAIDAALARMKSERRAAMVAGNMELAEEIADEMDELKSAPSAVPKVQPAAAPTKQVEQPPQLTQWYKDNATWYNTSPENEDMVAFADGHAARLGKRVDLSVEDRLEELDERVRKMFPDRFGVKKKIAITPGAGEGGSGVRPRTGKKSVSALPDDAMRAGQRYVKAGIYKTLEDYAEEYWKQPGAGS
jgi:hypothetical protein